MNWQDMTDAQKNEAVAEYVMGWHRNEWIVEPLHPTAMPVITVSWKTPDDIIYELPDFLSDGNAMLMVIDRMKDADPSSWFEVYEITDGRYQVFFKHSKGCGEAKAENLPEAVAAAAYRTVRGE